LNECIETSHVFTFLNENYLKTKSKILFALEGASGAAKTWGVLDFILEYCRINAFETKRIVIGRETYRDCIDTVAFDFFKRMTQIGWYDINNHSRSNPQSYTLFGNLIEFTGWSNNGQPSKRQDVLWFNEVLESREENFKQYNQRTNEVVLFDWNPKVTEHWVYDKLLNRPDCLYKLCLMFDNPFLPKGQRDELLRYEPTHPDDRHLQKDKRRPHPVNIKNGTADDFMSDVYLFGIRSAPTGVIFKYIDYIDSFPENIAYDYGMDFGWTVDPTTIVKCAEDPNNIWLELLCYEPIEDPETLHEYALSKGINIKLSTTADSSDKHSNDKGTVEMVKGLRDLGWNIHKVSKTKSVIYWILSMKKKKIHIVKNDLSHHAVKEAENYKLREINGIQINQPVDKFNHFWDSSRYRHMAFNQFSDFEVTVR